MLAKKISVLVASLFVLCGVTNAQAGVVYNVGTTFNGTSPSSPKPYLIATFETIAANTVRLTLQSSLETTSEFIRSVAFNVNPSIIPSSLTFTQLAGTAPAGTVANGVQNAQTVSGFGGPNGGWDITIGFPTDNASRFEGSEVAVFQITKTGLTENDFKFANTDTGTDYHLAMKIQGIPGNASGAAGDGGIIITTVVPEPTSIALLGMGVLGLAGYGRRRKK